MERSDLIRDSNRLRMHALCIALLGLAGSHAWAQTGSPPEAVNVYRDAASFQNNQAYELAVEEWGRFLKRFPDDPLAPKAQHYLGVCNLQLKRFEAAAEAFQAVIEHHPDLELIEDAYLNLGWCQYSLASQQDAATYAQAKDTFAAMVEKFPDGKYTDQGLFYAAEAEYQQGNREPAAALYNRLLSERPDSKLREDALYALGVTREELGQYPSAGDAYDRFLEVFPDSPLATEVRMRKGETILQSGDFAAAEKIFSQVAATEGFAAVDQALDRQAYCLAQQDKFAEAAEVYGRIPAEYAQSQYATEAAMSAGRCFYRAESWDQAARWFQQVVADDAKNAVEAAHWLCRIHLKNGQAARARELASRLLEATETGPFLVHLQMDLADALYALPDAKPQAVEQYLKIATEHPQHELAPQALYNVSFADLELGAYDEGLSRATAFLEAYPEHRLVPDVRYVAAECHLQRDEYAEAEKIYRSLTEEPAQHPDRETWLVRLGLARYLQKKYEETITTLQDVAANIQNAGNAAEAQFLVGASNFYLEKSGPAVKALRASLQADSQWKQADETTLLLARALRGQGKQSEANETLADLIVTFPDSRLLDQAHYRYGEGAYAAGEFAKAIEEYDAVIDGWPKSDFAPYALYNKGWAQMKQGGYAAAAETLSTLIDSHPQHALIADAHFARGMCLRQEGDYAAAIRDINVYLQSEPEAVQQCDALYERGLAEAAANDYAAAAASYREVLETVPDYASADKVLYELGWASKSSSEQAEQSKAAAAFAELAEKYPDSPLAAEANFHVAESAYDQAEYAAAVTGYSTAKAKSASDDLGEKATYKLAWSHYQLKDYQTALETFHEQVDRYPQGDLHADGLFMKAECLYRLEDYEQALPVYLAVQELKPSSTVIDVLADLHGGQSAAQLKQWDQAIALLSQIPEKHPDSSYLAEARYELGWSKQNAGQEDEALEDYEAAANGSRGEVGARARFMMGELLFGRKEFDAAIRQFQRVMYGYGGDAAPDPVKNWQAKSGFEAARCAEVQIQQAKGAARTQLIEDAKKAYRFVMEKMPQGELATKATERLQALSQL